MTPNQGHQSGQWRAYIETTPLSQSYALYVSHEDHIAKMEGGAVTLTTLLPGTSLRDDDCFMSWSGTVEDDMVDMWKAIGKAFDVYSETPGRAYDQGFAEGEAKVLREWNESLRA